MSARVARVLPSDRARLARFFSRVEPGFALDAGAPEWRWRMEGNPANPGGEVQAWIFELSEGGEVAGYLGTIPVALEAGGRRLRAAWSIDLVVLPEYRARGVTPFLYRAWLPTVDLALALGTTADSYAFLIKSGWQAPGSLTRFRRVLRVGPYLGPMAGRLLGGAAARLLAPGAPRRGVLEHACPGAPDLDALWARAKGGMGTAVARDAAYVHWRYRDRPGTASDVIALRIDGRLEGVAVLRERSEGGKRIGLLVDLWASPGFLPDLLDHAVHALAGRGVDVLHAYGTHGTLAGALARARFRPRPTSIQCLFRPREGLEMEASVFASMDRWWLTLGDSDQDRS